ncbi:hypothetical protein BS78_07G010200 [Paspalum vaginatum]|nr:hypothetical protein BS78_07G010200 [Paspalum vaginatum]
MGRRKRAKQAAAVEDDSSDDVARRLIRGLPGLYWLLFETPSGFAVFIFNNTILKEENAMELWLKQFLEFEDKSAAINRTAGLDKQLRDMLKIWTRPGETLVVGSLEHKEIIEADRELGVTCWYDDCVMEMMWGMKNLMRSLVPQEQKVLTKEERLPLSKGLQMILHRYNFDVKPEMVNDDIVETAYFLYDWDLIEKDHFSSLHMSDTLFMEISGLNTQDWSAIKLATAHMFSPEELSKIEKDREMYNEKFITCSILDYYDGLVSAYISMIILIDSMQGQEDLCECFFAYNRAKGTLYDGETRLFLRGNVYMYSMGGLADYCVVPANALAVLPDSLPYTESAILGCADSVAVIGVGGVGSSCLQIAKAFGASEVIAVDVLDEKLQSA